MSTSNVSKEKRKIYHERQSRQLCALHALNNLFQDGSAYSKTDLDKYAETLTPNQSIFNPHRSTFGLGDYDINVIIVALQRKNYEAIWFNKKKNLHTLTLKNIFGFILNIPNEQSFWRSVMSLFTASKRHWIAVRQIDSLYYNFDSKLKDPAVIGDEQELFKFLHKNLSESDAEIFVIVEQEIAKNDLWHNDAAKVL